MLLVLALQDLCFVEALHIRGFPEQHLRTWAQRNDVPGTKRAELRACLEDWACTNSQLASH